MAEQLHLHGHAHKVSKSARQELQQTAQKGLQPLAPETPSLVERWDSASMLGWFMPPILGASAALGRQAGKLGDWLGPTLGKPLRALRQVTAAPNDVMNAPLSAMASKVVEGNAWATDLAKAKVTHGKGVRDIKKTARKLSGGWFRKQEELDAFKPISEHVEGLQERFGGILEQKIGEVGAVRRDPMAYMDELRKFDAAKERAQFEEHAAKLEMQLKAKGKEKALKRLDEARARFNTFVERTETLKTQVTAAEGGVKSKAAAAGRIAGHENAVTGKAVAYASSTLGGVGDRLEHALTKGVLKPLAEAHGKASAAGSKLLNYAKSALGKEIVTTERTALGTGLGKALRDLPGKLASTSTHEALYGGLYGVSQAAIATRLVKGFSSRNAVVRHMYKAVTGKDASLRQIVTGDMPESLQEAKRDLLRTTLPAILTDTVGMVVNHKYMRPGAKMGMAAGLLVPALVGTVTGGISAMIAPANDLISSYRKVAEMQQAGKAPEAEDVAALLVAAKPKLADLYRDDPSLLKVAGKYAEKMMTAGDILKTIDSKQFDRDFEQAKQEIAALEAKAASAKPPEASDTKPVMGKFTAQASQRTPAILDIARQGKSVTANHAETVRNAAQAGTSASLS